MFAFVTHLPAVILFGKTALFPSGRTGIRGGFDLRLGSLRKAVDTGTSTP